MKREYRDLSVVIPAFNAAAFIGDAISSCVDAGIKKIIVIDDGSNDETAAIARASGAECVSTLNQGAELARRKGLDFVSTEYVIFLDADDELIADGIEAALSALRLGASNSAVGVIGGYVARPLKGKPGLILPWEVAINSGSLIYKGYAPGPPSCMIFVTSSVRSSELLPIPPLSLKYAEDYETLIRLSVMGAFEVSDLPVCIYNEGTGRSAREPIEGVLAASAIRTHYGAALGIGVRKWSERDVHAIAMRRRALLVYRYNAFWGFLLSVASFSLSPGYYFRELQMRSTKANGNTFAVIKSFLTR